jgi:hypothetical protein
LLFKISDVLRNIEIKATDGTAITIYRVQSTKLVLGIAVTIKGSAIKSSLKKAQVKLGDFLFK